MTISFRQRFTQGNTKRLRYRVTVEHQKYCVSVGNSRITRCSQNRELLDCYYVMPSKLKQSNSTAVCSYHAKRLQQENTNEKCQSLKKVVDSHQHMNTALCYWPTSSRCYIKAVPSRAKSFRCSATIYYETRQTSCSCLNVVIHSFIDIFALLNDSSSCTTYTQGNIWRKTDAILKFQMRHLNHIQPYSFRSRKNLDLTNK